MNPYSSRQGRRFDPCSVHNLSPSSPCSSLFQCRTMPQSTTADCTLSSPSIHMTCGQDSPQHVHSNLGIGGHTQTFVVSGCRRMGHHRPASPHSRQKVALEFEPPIASRLRVVRTVSCSHYSHTICPPVCTTLPSHRVL